MREVLLTRGLGPVSRREGRGGLDDSLPRAASRLLPPPRSVASTPSPARRGGVGGGRTIAMIPMESACCSVQSVATLASTPSPAQRGRVGEGADDRDDP